MLAPAERVQHYQFGVFTVDVAGGELRKHGVRLKLQDRPLQLLVCLLERPGEIVTREELRQRLWPDGTFVDFDHSISSAINKLRNALNDSASHPRYVETVGRRGYRFLADVRQVAAAETPPPVPESQAAPRPAIQEPARRRPILGWIALLAILLALAGGIAGYIDWKRAQSRPAASGERVMLAVLPFENLTGDAAQEYLSDGLTEEMIAELGQLNPEHLGVIARTSVMIYKHSPKGMDQIGHELGVQYVIEGSVRRDSNNVRITAQLIQVKDQTHIWAREYDRELKNLLTMQGEIAQEIADEILVSLGNVQNLKTAKRRAVSVPSTSYEAYDLYLQGRYFWNKRTPSGFTEAAKYFQQAIDKDPNYAPAYAGLADTFGLMSTWYFAPQGEYMPKARAAAVKALELDESLAEAHVSLGLIAENYDYDFQTAEKEFKRATQLNPEYATAHQWYAENLSWQGRFSEAFAESERARQLDPMSLIIATDRGAILYYSRQYDRALEQCREVLARDPSFSNARSFVFSTHVQQGKFSQALEEINWWSSHNVTWDWALKAYAYGRWGRQAQAQHALAEYEAGVSKLKFGRAAADVFAYSGGAPKDKLIDALERAYREHSPSLTNLKVDPKFDPFRNDPRFQDLLHRLRLDQ